MAARKPVTSDRAWTPDKVRERIKTSLLINALTDHVLKGTEMAPSRVTAGLGLLKKVIPDLSATAVTGSVEIVRADELSDTTLAHIATAGSAGASESASGTTEPTELH